MAERLRFGIMCHGYCFAGWEADCIRKLLEVAEPVLLIIDDGNTNTSNEPQHKLFGKPKRLFRPEMPWTLYHRYFVNRHSPAMMKQDLSEILGSAQVLRCRTNNKGKFSRYFSDGDIAEIRTHKLDFILRFAFGIVRGPVLEVPRHGVWSFHHDDIEKYRGGPPCFWEIERNDSVTGAVLQRINDRLDGGVILKRGYFRTVRTSYRRNRDNVYLGCTEWPAQICRELQGGNLDCVACPPTTSQAPIDFRPTRWQLAKFLAKCLGRYVSTQLSGVLRADQWNCGVINRPISSFLAKPDVRDVRWFQALPRSAFIADPMPLSDDKQTILVEGFDYNVGRGYLIGYDVKSGLPKNGQAVPVQECHLSYPFSFTARGTQFCVPEAVASGRLDAWALGSNGQWHRDCTLLDERILDPTLVLHDGLWWLFGTKPGNHADVKLWLWFAESPLGPWQPHPLNPVKCDVRSSRPAGPLFAVDGQLFRPAQNCSRTYGGSISINRIVVLTRAEFQEETVTELVPDQSGRYPDGLHTIAATGDRVVIDGKRRVFIQAAARRALVRRLTRLMNMLRQVLRRSTRPAILSPGHESE